MTRVCRNTPELAPSSVSNTLAREPLSERELEVLRLIVAGYSNREIAGPARDRGEYGEMVCQRDLRQTPGREPDEGHCTRKGTQHRVAAPVKYYGQRHLLFGRRLPVPQTGLPNPFSHPLMGANPPWRQLHFFSEHR